MMLPAGRMRSPPSTRSPPLKRIAVFATSLILLAGCGGSDGASAPVASDVADSAACSLTAEQIDDDTLEVLESHLVDGDTLLCDPSPESVEEFAIYTTLIPADFRDGVIGFVAIDQDASGGTDGAMQSIIGPDGDPTGERYLALDVTGSSTEIERTIVHEVGHTIFVDAATYAPTSYAIEFNELFPPGDAYTADAFVSEYAASSPDDGAEDIAESWAMFVFADTEYAGDADDDGELDVVCTDCVAADKVSFFDSYPELVELAEQIRQNAEV